MSAPMPDRQRYLRLATVLWLLIPLLAGCLPGRSAGERLYRRHCSSCHGVDGGGGVMYQADEVVDLLDDIWKYGGDPSEIEYSLLSEEVRKHETWDFTNQERQELVEHILILRGESH
jgi:mono/diheme cytochrome c family protein